MPGKRAEQIQKGVLEMRTGNPMAGILSVVVVLALSGCERSNAPAMAGDSIVGTWIVRDPNAPFPYHMYVFNADGTMQQANPDAGDPRSSDSDGKGVWLARDGSIKGKWVEIVADRASHKFTGRAEISFTLKVAGDGFAGTERVSSFDSEGVLKEGPTPPAPYDGKRVTLP
jgi:hypothetical protein